MLFRRLYGCVQLGYLVTFTSLVGAEVLAGRMGSEALGVAAFAWVIADPFGVCSGAIVRAELRWRMWPQMWRQLERERR